MTEDLCTRRIASCSGYIGVFGYRYGWQPHARAQSITHIEFDHAISMSKDRSRFLPIFLFLPKAGSVAAQQLRKLADKVLTEEFNNDHTKMKDSRTKQDNFRQTVAGLGRLVNDFSSLRELKQRISTSLYHYHTTLLDEIKGADPQRGRTAGIPSAFLGRIGRDEQIETIRSILLRLAERPSVPGACLIVHGRESAGLLDFSIFSRAAGIAATWRG